MKAATRIGVIVPVCGSDDVLADSLTSIMLSVAKARQRGLAAEIYVVVNGSSLSAAQIASRYAVHIITSEASDLEHARTVGARTAIDAGATWLAFTQAGAMVAETWLTEQQRSTADAVCGAVEITDRFLYASAGARALEGGHDGQALQHIDAANFSISSKAFLLACAGANESTRFDPSFLQHLTQLGLTVETNSKPMVYASRATQTHHHDEHDNSHGLGALVFKRSGELSSWASSHQSLFV